jgi:hypothetical protein
VDATRGCPRTIVRLASLNRKQLKGFDCVASALFDGDESLTFFDVRRADADCPFLDLLPNACRVRLLIFVVTDCCPFADEVAGSDSCVVHNSKGTTQVNKNKNNKGEARPDGNLLPPLFSGVALGGGRNPCPILRVLGEELAGLPLRRRRVGAEFLILGREPSGERAGEGMLRIQHVGGNEGLRGGLLGFVRHVSFPF